MISMCLYCPIPYYSRERKLRNNAVCTSRLLESVSLKAGPSFNIGAKHAVRITVRNLDGGVPGLQQCAAPSVIK